MAKVAKLVTVSPIVRVVVEESATDEQIVDAAQSQFFEIMRADIMEHLEEITDDTECPFGSLPDDREMI